MREASARAEHAPARGGCPNAWFAAAAAETLPDLLRGRVDELRVILPWGSLLRGVLGPEPWFVEAAGRILRPGAEMSALVSVAPRDGVAGLPELSPQALAAAYRRVGWRVVDVRQADAHDVDAIGSSWAKRLGIPARRSAVLLRATPPQASSSRA
jgi:16S rRNA (adenine(1408)-N(1))-methyltransferase